MYKPRKRREKSLSVPSSENLSDIINSCQEALELTKRQEIKDNSSMDASQFNDSYSERTVDHALMHDPKSEPEPMSQPAELPDDDDDDDDKNNDSQDGNQVDNVDKPIDDALNIYRNVDLPSDDDDNQTSNEEAINDMLEGTASHPTYDKQFPFNFTPRTDEANTNVPAQTNFNPLTSAFTAHPQTSLLNFFTSTNKNRSGLPTSAMLVEAALNSVSDASNEFIENVASGDDNNIDIESVSHKTTQKGSQVASYLSDNSMDGNNFKVKNGQASGSGSTVSEESKKSDLPVDVTYAGTNKKQFEGNFEEDRNEFESCSRNQSGFLPQRSDFYTGTNTVSSQDNNDTDLNFSLTHDYKKYDKCFQYLEEMKNLNESLKEQKRDVMSTESADCHFNVPQKLRLPVDDLHLMNKLLPNDLDLKFKATRKELIDNVMDFRNNFTNPLANNQMYSSLNFKPGAASNDFHNDLTMANVNHYNSRYQHHIHDILSDKEQHLHVDQPSQQQTQQDIHSAYIDHHMNSNQHSSVYDPTEQQSINLCKTAEYNSCMSPMPQNYTTHSEMLQRMNSTGPQDLCTSMSSSYMNTNNSPPTIHHPSFLNTQLNSHNNRDLSDHHRLLAPDKFVASRLLVDPVAHRFIEQHNRLLGSEMNKNDQKSLGLSLYHQQLPSHQTNPYHHEPVKSAANNLHANYHHLPFSAYYQ